MLSYIIRSRLVCNHKTPFSCLNQRHNIFILSTCLINPASFSTFAPNHIERKDMSKGKEKKPGSSGGSSNTKILTIELESCV